MSNATTHERLAAWLDGEAALYRERAQRAEDAQEWDPAVRYAGAADALVQLRDRVLLGEQIGPSPARQGRCRPGQNGGLAAIRAALRPEAQGEEDAVRRTWELAVRRAYGCLDYCGGYRGAELTAFHSGIKTVIRALEAGPHTVDTQTAALDRIGAARRDEGGGK